MASERQSMYLRPARNMHDPVYEQRTHSDQLRRMVDRYSIGMVVSYLHKIALTRSESSKLSLRERLDWKRAAGILERAHESLGRLGGRV